VIDVLIGRGHQLASSASRLEFIRCIGSSLLTLPLVYSRQTTNVATVTSGRRQVKEVDYANTGADSRARASPLTASLEGRP